MAPVSLAHLEALDRMIPAFEAAGIWYRATGGLAGNLHGSDWPLHDIDLDYQRGDWPLIETILGPYLLSPPESYEDEEFRLVMATAKIGSVEIDLCQLEDCFVAGPDAWHMQNPDPGLRERRTWQGSTLWALPLDDLIQYKELLGRTADLEDLKRLASAR